MNRTHHSVPDHGVGEKKLSVYVFGIVLCVMLTLLPFWAVDKGEMTRHATLIVIYSAAVVQFMVQLLCFLRLNMKTLQARMNVYSFILGLVILFIVVAGSLWIMWTLNYRMMH